MSVGTRLKEERERLGMTQDQFSSACGVRRRAQSSYENDERHPDSKYLAAAIVIGVDVGYLLTGHRIRETKFNHMDFHDFGWAAAQVLGISDSDLVKATESANAKIYSYGIDTDYLSSGNGSEDAYIALYFSEILQAVRPVIEGAIAEKVELDGMLLGRVLEGIDIAAMGLAVQIHPMHKSRVAVMLYRAFKASGKVDQTVIEETVALAAR
jgi:transcriptional regulator with XRE-family HTH domain